VSSTEHPQGLQPDMVVDGRYRLVGRVGSGGMADVWLAQDQQLGRRVALKLLHRRFAADESFVERFRREASHAAGLQHPNVVAVYDRGNWDGTWYIAMEYIEGPTLKEIVRDRGPLAPELAADLVVQVLRAARYAHRRGIVHRDLKPHNVILDEEGRVKVTDFGIARAGASEMTETGAIMGTAQYLSPEQAQGLAVDARSDLYSIGVLLYELLTGRVPFDAESAVTIALKHVSEPPVPPSELAPAVSPALEAVVERALAKDPAYRYADADEFIAALQAARDHPHAEAAFAAADPVAVLEEEDRRSRRWWLWLLALLALAAIAVAAWLALQPPMRTVPKVVGVRSAEASRTLQNRGFEVGIQTVVTPDVPKDRVATQDPQPGVKAREGSKVTITVSAGPGQTAVPAVVGRPRAEAEAALRRLGLKPVVTQEFSADVPAGRVISVSPLEGATVDKGTRVRLVVSRGVQPIAVPDVVGKDFAEARGLLEGAGLKVVRRDEESDRKPGTVTAQDPKAGAKARKGDSVTLTVAKGVEVPDVTDLPVDEARSRLEAAGFQVREIDQPTTDPARDGVVVAQAPAAGQERPQGATVRIRIGRAAAPTPTPTPTPTETPTVPAASPTPVP
jgi:beta-lactam-binding protein with PASTA domain/predicted Ser/Thr protein kinase